TPSRPKPPASRASRWRQTRSVTFIRPSSIRPLAQGERLELQRLHEALGHPAGRGGHPRRDVSELLVVAERLAVGCLVFHAEVTATGLLAGEGVTAHQLAPLEE